MGSMGHHVTDQKYCHNSQEEKASAAVDILKKNPMSINYSTFLI